MKKCELLVPAGGEKQFIAAVENGADAVYVGGPLYNARIGAGNFTAEEIGKAADYAHLRNVKLYVTMNTLMDEDELDAGLGFAEMLYEKGADALIIQDLGLGKLIRERMPNFPLHLSTQATVYNRRGLEAAACLGYERAVLARELSLEQIRKCSLPQIIETEVFVHGALCMCYSGQCQLSRFIGGRSGNKGRCAQPCRLPYSYGGHEGYPLSPKDLCMIDHLGDLIEAGVASLKIEGRMKSAEYVATVTGIYRKYLDEYYAAGSYKVSSHDRQELLQIFNRGGFTEGYAKGDPAEGLMSGRLPKNQGVRVGTVKGMTEGGILADVELTGPLEMGDVAEIHGRELTGMKITYLEKRKGGRVRIGDLKAPVRQGDEVYRIISEGQMKKARRTFENITFDKEPGRESRKIACEMVFKASCGAPPELTVSCKGPEGEKVSVKVKQEDVRAYPAENRALTEEDIAAQLSKTGSTVFYPEKIKIILEGDLFIPMAGINRLRRQALSELAEAKKAHYRRKPLSCSCGSLYDETIEMEEPETAETFMELYFTSVEDFTKADIGELIEKARVAGADMEHIRFLLPLRGMAEDLFQLLMSDDEIRNAMVPYIPNVTSGPYDLWLEENLSAAAEMVRSFGGSLYVGNISWIKAFAEKGIRVLGDFGLNITNRASAEAYRKLGMQGQEQRSLEEVCPGTGAFPLMITEHAMESGVMRDRKDALYSVTFDDKNHKTIIRSGEASVDWKQVGHLWKATKNNLRIYV